VILNFVKTDHGTVSRPHLFRSRSGNDFIAFCGLGLRESEFTYIDFASITVHGICDDCERFARLEAARQILKELPHK